MLSKNEKLVLLFGSLACLLTIANHLGFYYDTTISEYFFGEVLYIEPIIINAAFLLTSWGLLIISRREKVKLLQVFAIVSAFMYIIPTIDIGLPNFNNQIAPLSATYFLFGLGIIKISKFGYISTIAAVISILTTITGVVSEAYILVSLAIMTLLMESYILYKAREVL